MFWKLPNGQYLLAGAAEPLPVSWDMYVPGGEVIRSAAKYYVVTPAGTVVRIYAAPWTTSVEDTLYIGPVHVVDKGQLIELFWRDVFDHDAPEIIRREIALSGLVACTPGELPFDPVAIVATYELKGTE